MQDHDGAVLRVEPGGGFDRGIGEMRKRGLDFFSRTALRTARRCERGVHHEHRGVNVEARRVVANVLQRSDVLRGSDVLRVPAFAPNERRDREDAFEFPVAAFPDQIVDRVVGEAGDEDRAQPEGIGAQLQERHEIGDAQGRDAMRL